MAIEGQKRNRGGAREGAGRKPKPKPIPHADKGVASEVLATLDELETWRFLVRADDLADPDKRNKLSLEERREIRANLVYLTDRRGGKPAQGVFMGDTRESARELDFGDLPQLIAPGQPGATGKPN